MVIIYEKKLVRRFFANLLDYLIIFILGGMYIYFVGDLLGKTRVLDALGACRGMPD